MEAQYRYGVYLRPDFAMSRAQSEIHRLLRAQYNLAVAGRFMPHATLKGFFRSTALPATLIECLDPVFVGWRPFTVYNNGVAPFGRRSIIVDIKNCPDGSPNMAIYDLQERIWSALEPVIHPDCEFTPRDPRGLSGPRPFHPHLTLVMADMRPELQDEVLTFIREGGPVGPPQFLSTTYHLYRFAADWQGNWWQNFTWELLHSWRVVAE